MASSAPTQQVKVTTGTGSGSIATNSCGSAADLRTPPVAKVPLPAHFSSSSLQNKLVVIALEARGLVAKDVTGRSDPYCKVQYGSQRGKTKTIAFHLHPVWSPHGTFVFDIEMGAKEVVFSIWDKDLHSKDDFLGEASAIVPTQGVLDCWVPLHGREGKKEEVKGQLHVQIYHGSAFPQPQPDPSGGWSIYNYQDLIDSGKLKTGDVILFSGTEWISHSIKKLMHTPYSHCGMIVVMPNPRHPELKPEPFLVEADWDDQDYFQNAPIYGIVVNRFEDRMHQYDGDVIWYTPLKQPLSEADEKTFIDFVLELKGKKTKYDLQQGLTMMLKIENKEDCKSVFCSELVASALKKVGVIPSTLNPSMMGPLEVAKLECLDGGFSPSRVLRYHIHSARKKEEKKVKKEQKAREKAAAAATAPAATH